MGSKAHYVEREFIGRHQASVEGAIDVGSTCSFCQIHNMTIGVQNIRSRIGDLRLEVNNTNVGRLVMVGGTNKRNFNLVDEWGQL